MSFLTKDQLDSYLDSLPNNSSGRNNYKTDSRMARRPTSPTTDYHRLKNELVYPMQNLSVKADEKEQSQQSGTNSDIEKEGYGSIKDRMRRLKKATGTALSTTPGVTPAFPAIAKRVSEDTTFTISQPKNEIDPFEATLDPRAFRQRQQHLRKKQLSDEVEQEQDQQQHQQQHQLFSPPPPPPLPSTTSSSRKGSPPATPPPLPKMSTSSSTSSLPPPAIPISPRPPKPVDSIDSTQQHPQHRSQSNNKANTLNPIYAGLDCPKCQKPIEEGGEIVSVMEDQQIWHAHCFTCTSCRAPLEHVQYYEHEAKPYCEKDYKELFSLICDHCHRPIINQAAIRALGKHYHEGHFCCTACQMPLGDQVAFLVHEEKPYCQDDYRKLFGKKCSGCQQSISGQYVNALEQSWHPDCFVCTVCKKSFKNGSFLVRDNKPYCEDDYTQRSEIRPTTNSSNTRPALKPKPSIPKKPTFSPASSTPSLSSSAMQSPAAEEPVSEKPATAPTLITAGSHCTEKATDKKRCHRCRDIIDGPSANAFGHDYHIHHFQCSVCSRALSSRVPGMWQDDGQGDIICKMCAFKKTQH